MGKISLKNKKKNASQNKDQDQNNSENFKKSAKDKAKTSNNPKAYTFKSAIRAEQGFRRKQDIEAKKQHAPIIDRTPVDCPPLLVAVVGSPKVGKTSLILNLLKLFTKSPLTDVSGPVTIVTGKKQRVTFIECNNDINSMIDIAKVADLVLLLSDASFGFEMELFEFLNICQVHGMPKIIGVLTHLDMIKNQRTLKQTKKILKHRFWTEVYPGAKLFYLSGVIHGEYLKNEIKNLARFISITKVRYSSWQSNHSYFLVDRFEELTRQDEIRKNPNCGRNILLYGYLRGVPLKKGSNIHVPGLGDHKIKEIWNLDDPCPLPESKKRALMEKERTIYAPFSGIGGIVYDKDAVYVDLKGSHSYSQPQNSELSQVTSNLITSKETLDVKIQHSQLQIFSDAKKITADDIKEEIKKTNDSSNNIINRENLNSLMKNIIENDNDVEICNFSVTNSKLTEKTVKNLTKLVYENSPNSFQEVDTESCNINKSINSIGEIFKLKSLSKSNSIERNILNANESSLPSFWSEELITDIEEKVINNFVTGKWQSSDDAENILKLDDMDDLFEEDEKDIENNEKVEEIKNFKTKMIEKKIALKKKFDMEYDDADQNSFYNQLKAYSEKQSELNKKIYENLDESLRLQIEGCRPGMYVKIEVLEISPKFVDNFDSSYPIIVGGLNTGEENIGYVNVKIKKHRWYNRILKTNDPLIISMGWRRFQSIPIYYKLEDDLKCRYLKYTPQHVSCHAQFWGPVAPQNTGILALQKVNNCQGDIKNQGFRIAISGVVSELDQSSRILKKLKLVGNPVKIYKKTAFITGMFNSLLEVAKFEGVKIKTVSGIRGLIKKGIKDSGMFRATFEDKILLSDVVVCRTWFPVEIEKFYCPVANLLLPKDKKLSWQGIKTIREIKDEKLMKSEPSTDSFYTNIVREPKVFKPLIIPKKLQASLPYRDKPKVVSKRKNITETIAVIKDHREKKVSEAMKMLKTTYQHKQHSLAAATKFRIEKLKKNKENEEMWKHKKMQQQKRNYMRVKEKGKKTN